VLLVLFTALTALHGQSCTVGSNFNGTRIAGGNYVWFSSVISVGGLGSDPVTLTFLDSVLTVSVNGVQQNINVPAARVTFAPDTQTATTSFDGSQWNTSLPSSGLSGKYFLTGVAVQVPEGGWPGGIQPVSWTGLFSSDGDRLSVHFQWAAAVYTQFDSDYASLGVKPVDDNDASEYQNSDHAGSPEYFKQYVVGGARGGGGSNVTGSYSGTASCVASVQPS
jgi:hypothetical protein